MKSVIAFHDLQGLVFGVLMTSLGVVFLKAAGLVTGQTAGLSVLLSYVLSADFGAIFFGISIPFFGLAWMRRGPGFTIRTIAVVAGISLLTPYLSRVITFDSLPPLVAAILAGATSGVGLVALFRHKASAGGLGILALIIEERTGLKTGWFQLVFDTAVFLAASFILSPDKVVHSFVGAALVNAIIAWNFRLDQVGKL